MRAVAKWALALLSLPVALGAGAQTLDELLEQARAERQRMAEEDRQRIEAFRGDRDRQQQMLDELSARVEVARARSEALNARFEANEQALGDARASLDVQLGDLRELFGVVRSQATDARGVIDQSLISAQLPGRLPLLDRLAAAQRLPSIDDLDALRLLIQEEMTEQARVARFDAEVYDARGIPYRTQVVRVGAFNLVSGDRFLDYDPQTGQIREFGRQPRARYRADAAKLVGAAPGSYARMAIDPSYGSLLEALVREPGPGQRVVQGGLVGYVILTLGAAGLLLALWRGGALLRSGRAIQRQMAGGEPDTGNPLGRILDVYRDNRGSDTETLELKLDEAILRETPRLERWQGAMKIIAAVAPLLGLLGTVIGMIETFQQITLYGTGDPRLMADGISKALVTTMLGLMVAIPMVLLHSAVSSASRRQIEILEEQSAGMIARRSEGQ